MNKKKTLIFCTTEYTSSKNYGGLAVFLEKLLNKLKYKHKIILLVASDKKNILNKKNFTVIHLKIENFFLKIIKYFSKNIFYLFQSFIFNKKLNLIIRNEKQIQFIHFSNYQFLNIFYDNIYPVVIRLSSLEILWNKYNSIDYFLERKSLNNCQLILSPSNFLSKLLKKNYNLKSNYLPPILPYKKYKLKKIKNVKKFILTFGSISPGKGSSYVIKNIDNILKDNQLDFYWIGDVDKKFYKSNLAYEKILKQNSIYPQRIKILNKLNQSNLFNYIKAASIVVFFSYRDNSPNACMEALKFNKIILARSNSGYDDLIINNKNGFLFKKNEKNLKSHIAKILNLSKKEKIFIKKNIKKNNKLLNVDYVSKKYLDLTKGLIKS